MSTTKLGRPVNPIAQHRKARGLAREDLAILLELSVPRVEAIERNHRPPLKRIEEIAGYLGTPVDTLLAEFEAYQDECLDFARGRLSSEREREVTT